MTLVNIQATDVVKDSRTTLNSNFSYLDGRITSEVATINSAITDLDTTKAEDNAVVKLTGAQTIAGVKTFSSFPVTPSSAPTTDYQVANKKYVDDAAFAGVSDASETVKGVVEEATDAEVAAGTAVGATGAKLFITPAKAKTFADNKAKCRVAKSTTQAISGTTQVTFDTEDFDVGSNFASNQFTAPRTGYYTVDFITSFTSNSSSNQANSAEVRVNGTAILRGGQISSSNAGGHEHQISISGLLSLTASDVVTVFFSVSGHTATLLATTNTKLSILEI